MILPDRHPPIDEFDAFRAGAILEYDGCRYMVTRLVITETGSLFHRDAEVDVTMTTGFDDNNRVGTVLDTVPLTGPGYLRTPWHLYGIIYHEYGPDYRKFRLIHVWHPNCGALSET